MAANLQYPVVFEKLGLEPTEFEKLLESKMIKLIGVDSIEDLRKDYKMVYKSIEMVRKYVAYRAKTTDPTASDRRTISSRTMHAEGVLPDTTTSPQKVQEGSKGKQGTTAYDKRLGEGYHKEQITLFLEFQKQKVEDLNSNDKGYLLNGNGDPLNTIEFCNKLDGITLKYINELKSLQTASKPSNAEVQSNRQPLRNIYDACKAIVLRRTTMEWVVENDIMNDNGYKQWKEHVWVLMTFAGLLVIVDALSKSSKYGRKSFIDDDLPIPVPRTKKTSSWRQSDIFRRFGIGFVFGILIIIISIIVKQVMIG